MVLPEQRHGFNDPNRAINAATREAAPPADAAPATCEEESRADAAAQKKGELLKKVASASSDAACQEVTSPADAAFPE